MTNKILQKLNPVHLPTVSEFGKIADIICHNQTGGYEEIREAGNIRNRKTLLLQSRFEELTRGKWVEAGLLSVKNPKEKIFQPALLKKEMFICDDDDIDSYGLVTESAKSKVWFEGFEIDEGKFVLNPWNVSIAFGKHNADIVMGYGRDNKCVILINPTVFDFIIELDRYNRTAKEPIKINFTEAFVKELLK